MTDKKQKMENPIKFKHKQMQKKRKRRDNSNCFKDFFDSVKFGPIFICICCHQKHYQSNVKIVDDDFVNKIKNKYPNLSEKAFPSNFLKLLLVDIGSNEPSNYLCNSCRRHVE